MVKCEKMIFGKGYGLGNEWLEGNKDGWAHTNLKKIQNKIQIRMPDTDYVS